MPPGLVQHKGKLIPHQSHNTIMIVQGLNIPHCQPAAQFQQGLVIEGHTQHGFGENAPHRTADKDALGFTAMTPTAADVVDYLAQGDI